MKGIIFKPTNPWFSNSFFSEPDRLAPGLAATFSPPLPADRLCNFDQQPPAGETSFLLRDDVCETSCLYPPASLG